MHIVPYEGLWLFRDLWSPGQSIGRRQVWFGEDSLHLARFLPKVNMQGKEVLDLCTGSGIQGLIMASRGAIVTAVDINERAVEITSLNAAFNELEDRMIVQQGDLFRFKNNKKYDLIIANPLFLPVYLEFDSNDEFLFADGGKMDWLCSGKFCLD